MDISHPSMFLKLQSYNSYKICCSIYALTKIYIPLATCSTIINIEVYNSSVESLRSHN